MSVLTERDKQDLGVFLRQIREKQAISRQQMAHYLGKNAVYIGRLERGAQKGRPSVELIEEWMQYTKASFPQLCKALGLAGYIPNTQLPPLNQIKITLGQFAKQTENEPYPAYITDFRGYLWVLNHLFIILAGNNKSRKLIQHHSNILDLCFTPNLDFFSEVQDIEKRAEDMLWRFKTLNLYRQHEHFYRNCLEELKARIGINDENYTKVKKIWESIDPEAALPPNDSVWILKPNPTTSLYFKTVSQVIFQSGNLFQLHYHIPVNNNPDYPADNKQRVDSYLSQYRKSGRIAYKLWDLGDEYAQSIIDLHTVDNKM